MSLLKDRLKKTPNEIMFKDKKTQYCEDQFVPAYL